MRIAALLILLAAPASAGDPPRWMTGTELRQFFAGRTLEGFYPSGIGFAETYKPGGAIDYRDDQVTAVGNWSIVANDICTFYVNLLGGCFRAYRVSGNCFRFYLASDVDGQTPAQVPARSYEVTGWLAHMPSTCPPPPSV